VPFLLTGNTYVYGNSQILAQYDGDYTANKYFYLSDRLGSVRQLIDTDGDVVKRYTYDPFGGAFASEVEEEDNNMKNPFMFTGQWFDSEIDQYFQRARQYNPHLGLFTTRDPVFGRFQEPMTLHKYLYCGNDPINFVDINGKWALMLGASISANLTVADFPGFGFAERGLGAALGSIIGYYNIILPYYTFLAEHMGVGATGGAGFVVAKNEEQAWNKGWSFGTMEWLAGGSSVSTGAGIAGTIDIGYSPEAQHVIDLSRWFVEVGGSVSTSVPVGPGFLTGGFTASMACFPSAEMAQVEAFG